MLVCTTNTTNRTRERRRAGANTRTNTKKNRSILQRHSPHPSPHSDFIRSKSMQATAAPRPVWLEMNSTGVPRECVNVCLCVQLRLAFRIRHGLIPICVPLCLSGCRAHIPPSPLTLCVCGFSVPGASIPFCLNDSEAEPTRALLAHSRNRPDSSAEHSRRRIYVRHAPNYA